MSGKSYYTLDDYCKNTYNRKCYKIALDAQMTCPTRDGTLDTRGCIFCSAGGSGDYAIRTEGLSIDQQIDQGLTLFNNKKTGDLFIAYFQAFTNTYAPLPYLEKIFSQALAHEKICGISIATRPDCLPEEVLMLLDSLRDRYAGKFIWIELGLQTIHEETARHIRRGYTLPCFERAMASLHAHKIPVIVHVILGLPQETPQDMYNTIHYLNALPPTGKPPFGIKLQLLHVLKGTDLAVDYQEGRFSTLSMEAYLEILIGCIERLSPETMIHRVTGDGPRELLISPEWSLDKRRVLNNLHQTMKKQNSFHGKLYIKQNYKNIRSALAAGCTKAN